MKTLFRWSLPRGYSSNRNDNSVILLHIRKTIQIENLDQITFRNCLDAMFPLATCKTVLVILLFSKILSKILRWWCKPLWRFLLNSYRTWCCLHEDLCWTRIHVYNRRNWLKTLKFSRWFCKNLFLLMRLVTHFTEGCYLANKIFIPFVFWMQK